MRRNLGSGLIFGTKIGPDPTFRGLRSATLAAPTICALLVATLLVATVLRNRDYHSETAFWSAVLARDASNSRAWNNLGYALEHEQRDGAGALAAYERAIALDAANHRAYFNRGDLCARLPQEPRCAER